MDYVITSIYDQYHPISILADFLRDAFGVKMLRPLGGPLYPGQVDEGLPKVVESFIGTRWKRTGAIEGGTVDFASRELRPGSKFWVFSGIGRGA